MGYNDFKSAAEIHLGYETLCAHANQSLKAQIVLDRRVNIKIVTNAGEIVNLTRCGDFTIYWATDSNPFAIEAQRG